MPAASIEFGGQEPGGPLERLAEAVEATVERERQAVGADASLGWLPELSAAAARLVLARPDARARHLNHVLRLAATAPSPRAVDGEGAVNIVIDQHLTLQLLHRMALGAPRCARRQLRSLLKSVVASVPGGVSATTESIEQLLSEAEAAAAAGGSSDKVAGGSGDCALLLDRIAVIAAALELPGPMGLHTLEAQLPRWFELVEKSLAKGVSGPSTLLAAVATFRRVDEGAIEKWAAAGGGPGLAAAVSSVLHHAASPRNADKESCNLAGLVLVACHRLMYSQIGGAGMSTMVAALSHHFANAGSLGSLMPNLRELSGNAQSAPPLFVLGYIRGILSVLPKPDLLVPLSEHSASTLLTGSLIELSRIADYCRGDRVTTYVARETLTMWLKSALKCAKTCPSKLAQCFDLSIAAKTSSLSRAPAPTVASSTVVEFSTWAVQNVCQMAWDGWEHPESAVRAMARSIFEQLIALYSVQATNQAHLDFVEQVASQLLTMPWHAKARYGPLCEVARQLGCDRLMELHPPLLAECTQTLSVNALCRCGTKLFAALAQAASQEWRKTVHSHGEVLQCRWQQVFCTEIENALITNDVLTRHNAIAYMLPALLKHFPDATEKMLTRHYSAMQDYTNSNHQLRCKHLRALIAVAKVARAAGLISATNFIQIDDVKLDQTNCTLHVDVIQLGLRHSDPQIRTDALSLVACDRRRTAEVLQCEIDLIVDFLQDGICVSASATRQRVVASIEDFLDRLRGAFERAQSATVACEKSLIAMDAAGKSPKQCEAEVAKWNNCAEQLEVFGTRFARFVRVVNDLLAASLFPGASYPRAITAMRLWEVVFSATKGIQLDSDGLEEFPDLLASRNSRIILSAVGSTHADVREVAVRMIDVYFCDKPIRLLCADEMTKLNDDIGVLASANVFAERAWSTMTMHGATEGAALLSVVLTHYTQNHGLTLQKCPEGTAEVPFKLIYSDNSRRPSAHAILLFLIDILRNERDIIHSNLGAACRSRSAVGLLKVVSVMWLHIDWVSASTVDVLKSLVDVLCELAAEVMLILNPSSAKERKTPDSTCHSFADIDRALNTALEMPFDGASDEIVSISADKDRVLFMSWRIVTGVAEVLGALFTSLPKRLSQDMESAIVPVIDTVFEWFQKMMLTVRHRGMIECGAESLSSLCECLATHPSFVLRQLPNTLLRTCLSFVESSVKVSITRRGAGAPLAIVAALASCTDPVVLSETAQMLLSCTKESIVDASDKNDLAPVRAFNVLRAIYTHNAAASKLAQWCESAFMAAVNGFKSPIWAIRNSATMLLAALVDRMVGMKRVSDDVDNVKSCTANDFFLRYPALLNFLEEKLTEANVQCRDCNGVSPRQDLAYPLLTILSKLSRADTDDQYGDKNAQLKPLINAVRGFVGSKIFHLRCLASDSLVSLYPQSTLLNETEQWLKLASLHKSVPTNHIHGALLCVKSLFQVILDQGYEDIHFSASIIKALEECSWVLNVSQTSPSLLAVPYAEILDTLLLSARSGSCKGKAETIIIKNETHLLKKDIFSTKQIAQVWAMTSITKLILYAHALRSSLSLKSLISQFLAYGVYEVQVAAITACADLVLRDPKVLSEGDYLYLIETTASEIIGLIVTENCRTEYIDACATLLEVMHSDAVSLMVPWSKTSLDPLWKETLRTGKTHKNARAREVCLRIAGVTAAASTAKDENAKQYEEHLDYIRENIDFSQPVTLRLAAAQCLLSSVRACFNNASFSQTPRGHLTRETLLLLCRALSDDDNDVRDLVQDALAHCGVSQMPEHHFAALRSILHWTRRVAVDTFGSLFAVQIFFDILMQCSGVASANKDGAVFQTEQNNVFEEPAWLTWMVMQNISLVISGLHEESTKPSIYTLCETKIHQICNTLHATLPSDDSIRHEEVVELFDPTHRGDENRRMQVILAIQLAGLVRSALLIDNRFVESALGKNVLELSDKLMKVATRGGLPTMTETTLALMQDSLIADHSATTRTDDPMKAFLLSLQMLTGAVELDEGNHTALSETDVEDVKNLFPNPMPAFTRVFVT